MPTNNYTILEKKYKKLSIQIEWNALTYCIFDTLNHQIELLKTVPMEKVTDPLALENTVKEILFNTLELKDSFDQVLVLHNNQLFTIVPSVLFDPKNSGKYLEYNVKVLETDTFSNDRISNQEMVNVFVPYSNLNTLFLDKFGNFQYKHAFSILIEKLLNYSKNIEEKEVYVHIQKDNFQLIVVQNQKLIFFNSFAYSNKEDFIYYLLFTAEQLDLNPETFSLKLLGAINIESDLYQIAYAYIRNLSFLEIPTQIHPNTKDFLNHFIIVNSCE